jgi:hypothetical protein
LSHNKETLKMCGMIKSFLGIVSVEGSLSRLRTSGLCNSARCENKIERVTMEGKVRNANEIGKKMKKRKMR